jgi:hypothetical protein
MFIDVTRLIARTFQFFIKLHVIASNRSAHTLRSLQMEGVRLFSQAELARGVASASSLLTVSPEIENRFAPSARLDVAFVEHDMKHALEQVGCLFASMSVTVSCADGAGVVWRRAHAMGVDILSLHRTLLGT